MNTGDVETINKKLHKYDSSVEMLLFIDIIAFNILFQPLLLLQFCFEALFTVVVHIFQSCFTSFFNKVSTIQSINLRVRV